MIIALIVLVFVIVAAAVWFLARPLARGTHVEAREQYYQLLGVRDRLLAQLNELDLDERDRTMEADTAVDERARLEAELAEVLKKLDALAPEAEQMKEAQPRSKSLWPWTVAVLALIVPAVAASFFFVNLTVPLTQLQQIAAIPAPGAGAPDPLKMVARLEKRLQENPNDPQGWMRLGRSYSVLGRLDDAFTAYNRAFPLLPKDFKPETPEAFWFLGIAAYNHGDTKRAVELWRGLLSQLPPDSEGATRLKQVIQQAQEKSKTK